MKKKWREKKRITGNRIIIHLKSLLIAESFQLIVWKSFSKNLRVLILRIKCTVSIERQWIGRRCAHFALHPNQWQSLEIMAQTNCILNKCIWIMIAKLLHFSNFLVIHQFLLNEVENFAVFYFSNWFQAFGVYLTQVLLFARSLQPLLFCFCFQYPGKLSPNLLYFFLLLRFFHPIQTVRKLDFL